MKLLKLIKQEKQLTYWQWIFRLSKINGGEYRGDSLPVQAFNFPARTWFQQRLKRVRKA